MRRPYSILSAILCICLIATASLSQQDRLEGRWAGAVKSIQGTRPAVVTFKKSGDSYTGAISGLRGDAEVPLSDIKLEGDKLTAKSEVESPQGSFVINYTLMLEGETLKGKGELDLGGQSFGFDIELKRGGEAAQGETPSRGGGGRDRQGQSRRSVPQPQQEQSLEYFAGQWTFKWIGRESILGPGTREGTVTYTLAADGKSLEGRTVGTHAEGSYEESAAITFDEEKKILTFRERRAGGVQLLSKGDWSSPIAIRFTIEPLNVKGQTLRLRRTIDVISAHSFKVTEEMSEDGGPFVRLGNALFSKVLSPAK
ncbi:MAG: hypothetical protein L0229_11710 [Blastocatellia bacterium]|nr:hypothetical protein [Blastocatellia bacterium]